MTAAPRLRSAPRRAPFDLDCALGEADWRECVEWPLELQSEFEAGDAGLNGLVQLIREAADPDLRDILTLAGMRAFVLSLAHIEAALALTAARRAGVALDWAEPELAYLSGATDGPPATRSRSTPCSSETIAGGRSAWRTTTS